MNKTSFLEKISQQIISFSEKSNNNICVVLPNKRAKVFLLNELKKYSKVSFFSPEIYSIEELIQKISGIRTIDSLELLFEFYEVYCNITPKANQQKFEEFSSWAIIALQDFNEIDRYLIDANKIFDYLSEVKALERWQVSIDNKTDLIDNHLQFWKNLPKYYNHLYLHLVTKKVGYQGLIYREVINCLDSYSKENENSIHFFCGFNALNTAEEKIILHLSKENRAKIFWDIDECFLENSFSDVGLFIRKFKNKWKLYDHQEFNWASKDFQDEKNIQIIGTPKSIGQAKITGKIIEDLVSKGEQLDDCAVVLGDENLLLPILNSLPLTAQRLNITMGYPIKNNPVFLLLLNILKMHNNAIQRNSASYTYYYKEVIAVINHPLIAPYLNSNQLVHKIRANNYTFFNYQSLNRLLESDQLLNLDFFVQLLTPWENKSIANIIELLKNILIELKNYLNSNEDEKLTLTFLFSVYTLLNKIESYHHKYARIESIDGLASLFKQLQNVSEVSFEGEPLSGLQIMGVLESRVLDFKNVIITSVNEGKFPAGKSQQSYIPYDIKRELGLPTFKEKDAIYSYHFYHLLLRAENIFLLYNTDSEGIDAGEKSRFLQQLEIEKLPKHNITNYIYNAVLPQQSYERIEIAKTESLQQRLQEIATVRGFSPSSLTSYIRNPYQFYLQRVLRVNEADDVEEHIAVNTLGTIIHDSLEKLYEPFLGKVLTLDSNELMISNIDEVVLDKFKSVYKEGNISKGKNYIAFEIAKRNLYNFLQVERNQIERGEEIIVLKTEAEMSCFIKHEKLPYPIKIAGKVDRIEKRNGLLRIIDYKTGKVENKNLKIDTFEGLTTDIKNDKIIQLLCYALMYQSENTLAVQGIEVGIISFKNLKSEFLAFNFNKNTKISSEILTNFTNELANLVEEILCDSKSFIEKTNLYGK